MINIKGLVYFIKVFTKIVINGLYLGGLKQMRKVVGWSVILYLLFGLFIAWYLFSWADPSVPNEYKGSTSDPTTFLNTKELTLATEFSRIKNLLFFLSIPFEWLMYLLILVFGISVKFKEWSKASAKPSILQTAIYVFWLSLLVAVVSFPLDYISYKVSKMYHISTQTFSSWMKDQLIDFWVNYLLMIIIVTVLYWLIKKSQKRWWLYAWLLSVPFTIFLMFIQPVIIDPLYNDFYPLQNKELEAKILTLAKKADIPADHVFEVDMSEKTNSLNAYVTGIGDNSRIVLWDTTLNRLNDKEILFIMAHEMGHYVMKHIYFGIAGYLFLSFIGLYVTYRLMNVIIKHYGNTIKLKETKDIVSLPLFLLLISMLSFAASPLTNAASRYQEHAADKYAIEMTKDTQAAIQSFQKLTKAGLSEVNPPYLVKIFRYGHPTMFERINFLESYDDKKE